MSRQEVILRVWLPAYLAAFGRGHDPVRARDFARVAVSDYYEEVRRAQQAEAQLNQHTTKDPS